MFEAGDRVLNELDIESKLFLNLTWCGFMPDIIHQSSYYFEKRKISMVKHQQLKNETEWAIIIIISSDVWMYGNMPLT